MDIPIAREASNSLLGVRLPWFLRLFVYTSGLMLLLNSFSLFFPAELACVPSLSSTNLSSTRAWLNTRCNVATDFGDNSSSFAALNAGIFIGTSFAVALLFFVVLSPHFKNVSEIVERTKAVVSEDSAEDASWSQAIANPIADMEAGYILRSYCACILSILLFLASGLYLILLFIYGIPMMESTSFHCTVCANFNTSQLLLKDNECDSYRRQFLYGGSLNDTTYIFVQALCSVDHIMSFRLGVLFFAAILLNVCFIHNVCWVYSFGIYTVPSNWSVKAIQSTLETLYPSSDLDSLDALGLNIKAVYCMQRKGLSHWISSLRSASEQYINAVDLSWDMEREKFEASLLPNRYRNSNPMAVWRDKYLSSADGKPTRKDEIEGDVDEHIRTLENLFNISTINPNQTAVNALEELDTLATTAKNKNVTCLAHATYLRETTVLLKWLIPRFRRDAEFQRDLDGQYGLRPKTQARLKLLGADLNFFNFKQVQPHADTASEELSPSNIGQQSCVSRDMDNSLQGALVGSNENERGSSSSTRAEAVLKSTLVPFVSGVGERSSLSTTLNRIPFPIFPSTDQPSTNIPAEPSEEYATATEEVELTLV